MTVRSDDDVPQVATSTGHYDSPDGDTTAGAVVPPAPLPSVATEDDDEDWTVQQHFEPKDRHPAPGSAPAPTPRAPVVPRITSKKPPVVGLGVSLATTRPAAGQPPPASAAGVRPNEADAEDSITAKAPAARAPALPVVMPGNVQIVELAEDEPLDETEVRTLVGGPPSGGARPPMPAAGAAPASAAHEADELDESVTIQAPPTMFGGVPSREREPSGRRAPLPAAGRGPDDIDRLLAGVAHAPGDAYNTEESVTTRGPPISLYGDDSVTMEGPVASVGSSPADSELESITTEAPGHLTNMLRVIASTSSVDEDEAPENQTAVMLNAPPKPAGSVRGGPSPLSAAAAVMDLRDAKSDSGLRIARAEVPVGEQASLNRITAGGGHRSERASGIAPSAEEGRSGANAPSFSEAESGSTIRKPRYGLLVAFVALLSVAIPLTLFLWLDRSGAEAGRRSPATLSVDPVGRGDLPRAKATKGTPPASAIHSGPRGRDVPRRK